MTMPSNPTGLRVVLNKDGSFILQKIVQGPARGEFTQHDWVDVPVVKLVDGFAEFVGYEVPKP